MLLTFYSTEEFDPQAPSPSQLSSLVLLFTLHLELISIKEETPTSSPTSSTSIFDEDPSSKWIKDPGQVPFPSDFPKLSYFRGGNFD